MDTNKMRESMKLAYEEILGEPWESSGLYKTAWAKAWEMSWQASREAVVVELPGRDPELSAYSLGFNSCRSKSREAIEAQGLKVKP